MMMKSVLVTSGMVVGLYALQARKKTEEFRNKTRALSRLGPNSAVLITGCDSGFGFSLAVHCLKDLGLTVIAGCHMAHSDRGAKTLAEMGAHVLEHFDVTDQAKIEAARSSVDAILAARDASLVALVNNAAVLVFAETEWQTARQIQLQMDVNVVGPVRMTKAFLPLLRQSKVRLTLPCPFFPRFSTTTLFRLLSVGPHH